MMMMQLLTWMRQSHYSWGFTAIPTQLAWLSQQRDTYI